MTLIDRLSKLEGPDREVDAEIDRAFGLSVDIGAFSGPWTLYPDQELYKETDRYTASVDAAIALAERVLPGWNWLRPERNIMAIHHEDHSITFFAVGANPAIALCIAVLRAKEASHDQAI